MMVTKKLDAFGKKMDFGPKNCIFGPKFCIFLRYTYETPIFSARTVPTQWDHKSPISWGNSGYLRFSGRWPFGRSAGHFSAPIAQSVPFWAQKCCFRPKIIFCANPPIFSLPSWQDTKETTFSCCSWWALPIEQAPGGGCKGPFCPKVSFVHNMRHQNSWVYFDNSDSFMSIKSYLLFQKKTLNQCLNFCCNQDLFLLWLDFSFHFHNCWSASIPHVIVTVHEIGQSAGFQPRLCCTP